MVLNFISIILLQIYNYSCMMRCNFLSKIPKYFPQTLLFLRVQYKAKPLYFHPSVCQSYLDIIFLSAMFWALRVWTCFFLQQLLFLQTSFSEFLGSLLILNYQRNILYFWFLCFFINYFSHVFFRKQTSSQFPKKVFKQYLQLLYY